MPIFKGGYRCLGLFTGFTWCGLALLLCNTAYSQKLTIISSGKSDYCIVYSTSSGDTALQAARLLQQYIQQSTGVQLPIWADSTNPRAREILVGKTNRTPNTNEATSTKGLQAEGYQISTQQQKLVLMANTGAGLLNAATGLLEDYVGCRMLSPTVTYVPRLTKWELNPINDRQVPANDMRIIYTLFGNDTAYMRWRKLHAITHFWKEPLGEQNFVHTFQHLVPAEEFFKPHPEYFALVNKERVPGQLCLTNPNVLALLINRLKALINTYPAIQYWGVSQNDNYNYCQCATCAAINKEENSPAGSLIRFVNEVARQFPDKTINTLAYQYSRKPPAKTRPLPNVLIMLCTIELDRSKPITTGVNMESFKADIEGWAKMTSKLFIWDYGTQFTHLLSVFPMMHIMAPNIRFFNQYKILGQFHQINAEHGFEWAELKAYVLSKLLWNPKLNTDALMDDFLRHYYGEAAPFLKQYIAAAESKLKASGNTLEIYGSPANHINGYLSPASIAQYEQLFSQAEYAVRTKPELLNRVKLAKLPVLYAKLEIAKANLLDKNSWYPEGNTRQPAAKMKQALVEFDQITSQQNVAAVNELRKPPKTYLQEYRTDIDVTLEPHLALRKPTTVTPSPTSKYAAGGAATLTDGIRGTTAFTTKWLGWYDKTITTEINLGSPKMVNLVQVGTLQDAPAGIMHPVGIEVWGGPSTQSMSRLASYAVKEGPRTGTHIVTHAIKVPGRAYQWLRIVVTATPQMPAWSHIAGYNAATFIDEIKVK